MTNIINKEFADPNYRDNEEKLLITRREKYWQNCLTSFFLGALENGYDFNNAWLLLLNSSVGQGILNHKEKYKGLEGFDVVILAEQETGLSQDFSKNVDCSMWHSLWHLNNLSNLIFLAHFNMGISYDDLFKKMSINEFMFECGTTLGDYDDKLIKNYLL